MVDDKRARLKQWIESGEVSLHPLTFPQRELWETSAVPVADPANHICCLIHVRGLITPENCQAALRRVVERQEALRLSFVPGREQPLQLVRKSSDVNLRFQELAPGTGSSGAIEELAQEIFRAPFDLMRGPLYRAVILPRRADEHVLIFTIHHAIADGWTLGVFVRDLFSAYVQVVIGMSEPLPPVPLTYTAWAAAERAFWQPTEIERRADFWRAALADGPRLWSEPCALSPLQRWVAQFPVELTSAVRELSRRNGATLFSTLLAAFQLTLAKWTGQNDLVVGTPVANRTKQAVRETMGYCSGVVPLRARVEMDRTFAQHLRLLHQTTVDCFAHAIPFAELVRVLGEHTSPCQHPVFQVRFSLQNHPIPDVALPTLSAKLRMRSTGTARFDLGCELTEQDDGLEAAWLFRPNRFSHIEIEQLHRAFERTLTNACRSPENRVAAILSSPS